MSALPDEIWLTVLEIGVTTGRLDYRDLCCLSISGRRLHLLSSDPALWSTLLARDFLHVNSRSSADPPSKSLYRTRFERDRARRVAAWRRRVLFAESQVAVCRKRLEELEGKMVVEGKRMKEAQEELANLERARQASVALNVWQPEVIRGSQKQIVEQCTVPIEYRLSSLKMEIRVCKQQIAILNKAYNDQKQKLSECTESLKSLKYDPLQGYQLHTSVKGTDVKQKKMKQCGDCEP